MTPRATNWASVKALGWCACAVLGASLLIASCSNSSSSSAPDKNTAGSHSTSNGSDEDEIRFDLKKVTGRLELSAERVGDGCTSSTTSSVVELSAGDDTEEAASFERKTGHFSFKGLLNATQLPVQGSATCGSSAVDCSSTTSFTRPAFVFVDSLLQSVVKDSPKTVLPDVPEDTPDEFAFYVNLPALPSPDLCQREEYAEQKDPVYHFGPVSVAQLEAGRFVLRSKGSKRVHPAPLDEFEQGRGVEPATLDGTLSWNIELTLEARNVPVKDVEPPSEAGVVWYDQCVAETAPGPENLTAELEQAIEDGAESVDLDPDGCFRRRVTVEGDTTTVEVVHVTGTDISFNGKKGLLESTPTEEVVFRSTAAPALWNSTIFNAGEPIYERSDEWDDAGTYLGGTATEHQAEGAAERWVSTPVDEATLTVVHDTLVNGDVTSTEEWTQALAQAKGPAAGACVVATRCNSTAIKSLLKKLWNGRNGQGAKCMERLAPNAARQIGAMVNAGSFNVVCGDLSGCPGGASAFTVPDQNGFSIYISDALVSSLSTRDVTAIGGRSLNLTSVSDAAFRLAVTLFHESLHSLPTFSHSSSDDPYLGNPQNVEFANRFSRAYACEVTCFAPDKATACNCRRCAIPEGNNGKGRTCPSCNNYPPADCGLYACKADKTLWESAAACKADCGSFACQDRTVPMCMPSE